jgi:hypothetical protein
MSIIKESDAGTMLTGVGDRHDHGLVPILEPLERSGSALEPPEERHCQPGVPEALANSSVVPDYERVAPDHCIRLMSRNCLDCHLAGESFNQGVELSLPVTHLTDGKQHSEGELVLRFELANERFAYARDAHRKLSALHLHVYAGC